MRSKEDFLNEYTEYIDTLVGGNDLTDDELKEWIKKECADYHEKLTECEIEWIVEEVRAREKEITVEDAEKMVVEGDYHEEFIEFLKDNGKKPEEWDYDDLGEFFRGKGYITV